MKKCLIVDDSKIVRKVVRRILDPHGFDMAEAEDGQDALNQVKAQAFDFIILDWNMPVMDGVTFLKEMRADSSISQPKVIFCTTENDFSKIETALSAGADEYVMKPFDEEIIIGKLTQLGIM